MNQKLLAHFYIPETQWKQKSINPESCLTHNNSDGTLPIYSSITCNEYLLNST